MVTLFAWMAHKLVSSNRCTMKSSVACRAASRHQWSGTMLYTRNGSWQFHQVISLFMGRAVCLKHPSLCCPGL